MSLKAVAAPQSGQLQVSFPAYEGCMREGCVANILFQSFSYSLLGFREEGGMFKGRHFDRSVILL
ncbi:hypothetical protein, partial [Microvirga subterranea]